MVKDLICGMEINEKAAGCSTIYGGKTYFFCSEGCRAEFLRRPETYLTLSRPCCNPAPEEKKHNV